MSEAMVNATITQLLSMDEMIQRVDSTTVAEILLPQAGKILEPIVQDLTSDLQIPPKLRTILSESIISTGNQSTSSSYQRTVSMRFLKSLTEGVQSDVDRYLSLRNCVVKQMMADR